MFTNLAHSLTGWIHLIASIAALILGTQILVAAKGSRFHKRTGYGYVVAMVGVNVTSFLIYRLFGGFGPFHIAAIISSLTLLAGMVPILLRAQFKNWLVLHLSFMYYSVIGLYAAFASEVVVRIPSIRFWWSIMGATLLVMFLGMFCFQRLLPTWIKRFGGNP